jgi:hypothetical protein
MTHFIHFDLPASGSLCFSTRIIPFIGVYSMTIAITLLSSDITGSACSSHWQEPSPSRKVSERSTIVAANESGGATRSRLSWGIDVLPDQNELINLQPRLRKPSTTLVRRFARQLLNHHQEDALESLKQHFFLKANARGRQSQALRVAFSVLVDLKQQGWTLQVSRSGIWGQRPQTHDGSPEDEKRRLRATHLHERNNQLRQPATREFIRKMERPRLTPKGWMSIFSLMRDGKEFADSLRHAVIASVHETQPHRLQSCISPYIQIVEKDSICQFTGLRLGDIWRYFRHTWTTPYNSTPGRKMWILIRDAVGRNHPIVGIGAVGSAVVQLSARDAWIGWRSKEFFERLSLDPPTKWAKWLRTSLAALLKDIYKEDFLSEGILRPKELRSPSEATISRLLAASDRARSRHQKYPQSDRHKGQGTRLRVAWKKQTSLSLFRAKRAEKLANLLDAKRKLSQTGFRSGSPDQLRRAMATSQGRRAIEIVLKHVKASRVGIDMLDITVCGAVAPYNFLLGGKLVSLLLTSPEIVRAYTSRYSNAPSVIASSMAGRPIRRTPKLVLLGTTGLYRINPSQYNRLRLDALEVDAKKGESIRFEHLGESEGFGSYHLSFDTSREIDAFLAQSHPGTRVNSIFGEGVNPKLRKLRAGIDLLGLDSNVLLNHRSSRVVYGVPLASNFRDVLLGLTDRPLYILPQAHPRRVTEKIAQFWMRRWLAHRILNHAVLETAAIHSLAHPISHGARVVLPPSAEDVPPSTSNEDGTTQTFETSRFPLSGFNMVTTPCSTQR